MPWIIPDKISRVRDGALRLLRERREQRVS
jgi:hypothetical protein